MASKPPISGPTTKNTKLKSVNVEIPVKHEPTPRYTPGSGPPLQRPKLFNRRDSTAYIIDRVFRPAGLAKDGLELPKQVMYFIGWRDLPAATHMVPAMDVLDYVSPTELEEWESKMQDDLDERVESAKLQKKEGKAIPAQTGKRKRGPGADSGIEGTIATLQQPEESESQEHDKRRGAPMSLSTPQKRRMTDFDEVSEELTPSKQILAEDRRSVSPEASVTLDFTTETTQAGDIPTTKPAKQQPTLSVHGDWTPSATETMAIKEVVMNNAPTIALPIHEVPRLQQRLQGTVIDISSGSESEQMQPASRTPIAAPRQTQAPMAQNPPLTPVEAHAAWLRADPTRRQVTRTPPPTSNATANAAQRTTTLPEWRCKQILEFEYREARNGEIERMFGVLWQSNWTKAEKHTWEPQAKLPKAMVQAYFDKLKSQAKQQRPNDLPQSDKLKQSTLTWGSSQNAAKHVAKQAHQPPAAIIADSTSNTKDELD